MLKSEAAAYLAGVTQTEGAEASAPTNLHVITGEVGEASADGKTLVKIDGLMFSESDDQFIEVDALGGLEEGDIATIVLTGEQGHAMTPLALGSIGSVDRITVRIAAIEADYIKVEQLDAAKARIGELEADHVSVDDFNAATGRIGTLETTRATITDLEAATARIDDLEADHVTIDNFEAATARIGDLEADHVSTDDLNAATGRIGQLEADTADIDTIRANSAKVQNLTAAQLEADHATIGTLDTTYATIANLNAANGRIANLESTKANISDLEADYITADEIEATYMHANMSNSDVAWIQNGTIKDGAIVSAMINDVSANKLTAGTINGSVINVTNLNADNITTGTINGQRIGEGSLSLSKLEDDVYTESEVDAKLATMQSEIDGAIETWTGTAVPTLNNSPASNWTTAAVRDTHVGDVYFVVNSQSQQNGYNYRFTKSGSTYSWQLIKDSDVTNALQRLETAEGKITTFDSDISTLKTDTGSLTTRTTNLETRMSDAEDDILDKVDTTTFNEVSDTVDQHSQTISQHTTAIANKADSSTVTAVTNRVSKNEQDISGINTTIGELQDTVETKADGSTVSTISNKLNTVSDTVDGHTQTLTSVQNTLSTKADSSTVSTLTTKVNNVSDTVDGHTSQLSSITTTQTTMQGTLDKTVKSSIQLWYSKANTTAPSKPTSKVTSTSTSGNAWRIVVPAYNSSYPHYFYCWQYEYVDGTYGWSAVVRDIAMGESQSTARTADSNASAAVTTANTANTNASTALTTANTANTNASDAKTAATTASTTASEAKTTAETAASDASTAKTNAASAVSTANSANTKATNAQSTANANIKSSVQLWFTKANSTAPNKPTSVVSTSNANTANAWNLVVPVWNKNYPHYFYCYQQQKGDGNYQWTDVVYDRATSEAQQLANTTSTNLSTLQTNYATFKQQTEQFESTVGTTYATKTELKGATDDITELESRVSTNETSISNNASAIALKANSSDVYTKSGVDGLISTEVTNRNAAITAKANEITSTVSQTYTTKEEFENLEIGGRNLLLWSGDANHSPVTRWGSQNNVTSKSYDATYDAFKYVTPADSGNHNNGMAIYTLSDGWTNSYGSSQIVNGSSYVFSIDVMGTLSSGNPMTMKIFYSSSAGDWNATPNPWVDVTDKVKSDSFTRVSVTFTLPSTRTEGTRIVLSLGAKGATFYVKNPKLELGNKATAWTPAPEDATDAIESAKAEIKVTTDAISSTVEKVSSVKYLISPNSSTLASIKEWATEGFTSTWTVTSGATGNLRVGDTIYLQYGDNTRGCKVYIKGTVNRFTNNSVNFTSHGYEDVLPVETIKSTINQSSDSVKIQAKHVEIDGTAIFSAISDDVDDAITDKGYATTTQAQGYASTAKSEAISAAASDATTKANAAQTAATNAANTATDNKLKSYSTTAQANNLYDAKGAAATAKSEAISAAANDATNKANEAYDKIQSRGVQLVTNGNGYMRDNTNWPALTFDGTKANGSPGSFTKSISYSDVFSEDAFPIDVEKQYAFEFDAISSDGTGRLYAFLPTYDVDDNVIIAPNVMYIPGTLTTLASDLNPGDTTVKLTSAAGWKTPTSYAYQRSLIFWDYKNSNGYTYPPETYSRNFYFGAYSDDSKVNKSTGVITLASAWSGPKKLAGTQVSQGNDGGTYVYSMVNVQVPSAWTHYYATINGLDTTKDGVSQFGKFRQGSAFARVGFFWNYGVSGGNQGQIWVTNISVKEATVNQATLTEVKNNAVKRTQRIWYRTNASSAPATPGTASSNWVTKADDGNDAWTKMHIAINSTHKHIYTCEQYEMANGTVGYTSVLLDNTITVIDGGNIITGTVTANKLNAANINASKTLTVGAMTDAAASTILNSNVQIGGRNLLGNTENRSGSAIVGNSFSTSTFGSIGNYNDSFSLYSLVNYDGYSNAVSCATSTRTGNRGAGWYTKAGEIRAGETYTFSCRVKCSIATNVHTHTAWRNGSATADYTGWTAGGTKAISANTWTDYSYTFVPNSIAQLDWEFFVAMCITGSSSGATYQIAHAKLEKGNKATDWTPAPEDMATAESLAGTNESLEGAIVDIGELSDQLVGTVTEQNKTITTIQTYLNSLRRDLDAEIQSRQQWLNFDAAEGLVIGAKNSTFKTVTTNTSQQFRSGGTVLAETSGTEFVAPVMRSDQLLIGNWMWTRRDNGNLSLKWIG